MDAMIVQNAALRGSCVRFINVINVQNTDKSHRAGPLLHAEFELCLACGAAPEDILFAHPCKYPSHLRAAAAAGINRATFDTECELRKVAQHHPTAGTTMSASRSIFPSALFRSLARPALPPPPPLLRVPSFTPIGWSPGLRKICTQSLKCAARHIHAHASSQL